MAKITPKSLARSRKVNSDAKGSLRKSARKPYSPTFIRGNRISPFKGSVSISKSRLFTIQEESREAGYPSSDTSSSEANLLNPSDDISVASDEINISSSSDLDGWEDEATLVARLQIDMPRTDDKDALVSLVHQLEGPMEAKGEALRRYLAHTVAPVAKRVKEANKLLEQKVDVAFGVGIISFDDACKKVEKSALEDEEDWKMAYLESQRKLKGLLTQLDDAYTHRENLWVQLEKSTDECASRALQGLSTLPTDLEEVITDLEKKAKALSKNNPGDGKTREKILRDLLGNM